MRACHAVTPRAVLAGEGAPAMVWLVVGRRAWTVVLHANLAWPPSTLDRVVATPAFHHRHHCEELPPANFASTLPLLDQVLGTFAPAAPPSRVATVGSCPQSISPASPL